MSAKPEVPQELRSSFGEAKETAGELAELKGDMKEANEEKKPEADSTKKEKAEDAKEKESTLRKVGKQIEETEDTAEKLVTTGLTRFRNLAELQQTAIIGGIVFVGSTIWSALRSGFLKVKRWITGKKQTAQEKLDESGSWLWRATKRAAVAMGLLWLWNKFKGFKMFNKEGGSGVTIPEVKKKVEEAMKTRKGFDVVTLGGEDVVDGKFYLVNDDPMPKTFDELQRIVKSATETQKSTDPPVTLRMFRTQGKESIAEEHPAIMQVQRVLGKTAKILIPPNTEDRVRVSVIEEGRTSEGEVVKKFSRAPFAEGEKK